MLVIPYADVPLHCINEAAIEFNIPAKLIISILNIERGKIGQTVKNKNGTYDIGPMQINSSWLSPLSRRGITQKDIQYNPCINVKVGSWILSKEIAAQNNLLTGIGNYHSHTHQFNERYYSQVKINFTKITLLTH
ncbi:MAG: lytic transglycosylase domain-containing protein [Gammaproteobacteria bacterium]